MFEKIILNEGTILNLVKNSIAKKQGMLLTYMNAHCFNIYNNLTSYRALIINHYNIYPDGLGAWILLRTNGIKYKIFNATDINSQIMSLLQILKAKVLFIGGSFDINTFLSQVSAKGIQPVGYINGYISESSVIDICKTYSYDVIILGMGVPLQEQIGYKLSEVFPDKTIICTGNFINYFLGYHKRAPIFMRKLGIEWLYRLFSEPSRLWKRYLLGIPFFLIFILKTSFRNKTE